MQTEVSNVKTQSDEYVTTEGGYLALKVGNSLLIREFWGNNRLVEDGETPLEYKMRLALFKKFRKVHKQGTPVISKEIINQLLNK